MGAPPQSHRIGRLSLQLSAASEAQAFGLRTQLRQAWETILPALGARLDPLTDAGQWLRIPRLELRTRAVSAEELLALLPELLARAIEDRLRALPPAQGQGQPHRADAADVLKPAAAMSLDTLLIYLERGTLPWFAAAEPPAQSEWRSYLSSHFSRLLARLPQVASYELWCRLLPLLEAPQLEALIQSRLERQPRLQPARASLLRLARACHEAPPQTTRRGGLQQLLASVLADSPSPLQQRRQQDEVLHAILPGLALRDAELAQLRELLDDMPAPLIASPPTAAPEDPATAAAPAATDSPARTEHCAGLVLLCAYLPELFKRTDIAWTAAGVDFVHLDRAAALLAYIATGDPCPAEYQLGLIKILLGLTPESPLPLLPGLLAQPDLDQADTLLQSLIAHWTAVGKLSADGLRRSFLQRSGLVRKADDRWLLQVERTGYDLLLDRFPFSFSLVKLPWMTQAIHVEW